MNRSIYYGTDYSQNEDKFYVTYWCCTDDNDPAFNEWVLSNEKVKPKVSKLNMDNIIKLHKNRPSMRTMQKIHSKRMDKIYEMEKSIKRSIKQNKLSQALDDYLIRKYNYNRALNSIK